MMPPIMAIEEQEEEEEEEKEEKEEESKQLGVSIVADGCAGDLP